MTRIAQPTLEAVEAAATLLRAGSLVALPTETVYGLAADATDPQAVAAIYETKGRPRFNPLICHVADAEAAADLAVFDARAHRLATAFWPGPLTLVLPKRPGAPVADLVTAGLDSIAVRVPDHPVALAVLRAVGRPLAAPSANASGTVSPTAAAHVAEGLDGKVDLILDGGPCRAGIESTILACDPDGTRLLRPGAVPRAAIEEVLGEPLLPASDEIRAPGALARHYAPAARLRLDAEEVRPGEALLAFGPTGLTSDLLTINLSETGDLAEAAATLFGALRRLDAVGVDRVAVMPIPEEGLGEAIADRLRRAAVREEVPHG